MPEEIAELAIPAPFGWVGGKHQLSSKIVPLIPPHRTYVEPFCGSAAVFWRKEPVEVEVLNDKDADLMRFYRQMGDIDHCDIKTLSKHFDDMKYRQGQLEPCEFLSLLKCSFGDKRESKAMPSDCSSNAVMFHKRLPQYRERIKGVKLLNQDWQKVVLQYDSPDTFIFLDPPYHGTSRAYAHGEDQLGRLAEVLPKLQGKWLLTYDDDPEVREAFEGQEIMAVNSRYTIGGLRNERKGKQLIITNYPVKAKMADHIVAVLGKKKATGATSTASSMLKYQYSTILDQLILLQLHTEDPTCPCSLRGTKQGEIGEYCEPKHLRAIVALARETIPMESNEKKLDYLDKLVDSGMELLSKMEDLLCGKEVDIGEYGSWARNWRKPLEVWQYSDYCAVAPVGEMARPYEVCQKVELCHNVDAGSKAEAVAIARDRGEVDALTNVVQDWRARRQAVMREAEMGGLAGDIGKAIATGTGIAVGFKLVEYLAKRRGEVVVGEMGGPKRVRYDRGDLDSAIAAAKRLKADHRLYIFATAYGYNIEHRAPIGGQQYVYVDPDGKVDFVGSRVGKEEGAMGQDGFKEVGPYLVHRYDVLGTGIMVYDVYEVDKNDHSTIMSIRGRWYGRVGTRMLPEQLAKLPPGNERVTKVMRWLEDQYREAYGVIIEAYPELKSKAVRWSMGEAVTLKEGKMEEQATALVGGNAFKTLTVYVVIGSYGAIPETIGLYLDKKQAEKWKKDIEKEGSRWEVYGPYKEYLNVPTGAGLADDSPTRPVMEAIREASMAGDAMASFEVQAYRSDGQYRLRQVIHGKDVVAQSKPFGLESQVYERLFATVKSLVKGADASGNFGQSKYAVKVSGSVAEIINQVASSDARSKFYDKVSGAELCLDPNNLNQILIFYDDRIAEAQDDKEAAEILTSLRKHRKFPESAYLFDSGEMGSSMISKTEINIIESQVADWRKIAFKDRTPDQWIEYGGKMKAMWETWDLLAGAIPPAHYVLSLQLQVAPSRLTPQRLKEALDEDLRRDVPLMTAKQMLDEYGYFGEGKAAQGEMAKKLNFKDLIEAKALYDLAVKRKIEGFDFDTPVKQGCDLHNLSPLDQAIYYIGLYARHKPNATTFGTRYSELVQAYSDLAKAIKVDVYGRTESAAEYREEAPVGKKVTTHPYARQVPASIDFYTTTIEKHYYPTSAFHPDSIRAIKPTPGVIVYVGCAKQDKWDANTSTCTPNPTIVKSIVPNDERYRGDVEHLKKKHPGLKITRHNKPGPVEPRLDEPDDHDENNPSLELPKVIQAINSAKEI